MKNIMLYGAGNYLRQNFYDLAPVGLQPLCIADRNSELWGTTIIINGFQVKIMSLSEALGLFQNAEILITILDVNSAVESLQAAGVSIARIIAPIGYELRKGCEFIGNNISLYESGFYICCGSNLYREFVESNISDFPDTMKKWYEFNNRLISRLRSLQKTNCDGCSILKWDYYTNKIAVKRIGLASDFSDSVCNFNCTYCLAGNDLHTRAEKKYSLVDVLTYIHTYIHESTTFIDKDNLSINVASGEIGVLKNREIIFYLIDSIGCKVGVNSNASIELPQISYLAKLNRLNYLIVSLDCGLRRTFAEIKGVDLFNKVIQNLKRYCRSGVPIILQYIFLPDVNDDLINIERFVQLAKSINASIAISNDETTCGNPLPQNTLASILALINNCIYNSINFFLIEHFFLSSDLRKIRGFIS